MRIEPGSAAGVGMGVDCCHRWSAGGGACAAGADGASDAWLGGRRGCQRRMNC